MKTVLSLLSEASQQYKNIPYVVQKEDSGWEARSFKQVERESDLFAKALISRGFKEKDSATILCEGRRNWVISEFGLLKARLISVPLSIKLLTEEIPFRINHSESKIIIVSENTLEKVLSIFSKLDQIPFIIVLDQETDKSRTILEKKSLIESKNYTYYNSFIKEGNPSELDPELLRRKSCVKEDDTVTISYSSGTTGNPKGIMLTHKNYWRNSLDASKLIEFPLGAKSLIILPLDHSFAHTVGIYISLIKGLSMYFVDSRGGGMASLRNIPKNLKEVKPYFLLTVPALSGNFMKNIKKGISEKGSFVNSLFNRGLIASQKINKDGYHKGGIGVRLRYGLDLFLAQRLVFPKVREIFGGELRFCIGGGALLEIKQQEFFNAIGVPVFQGYGLTEAAPIICSNQPTRYKFGTSGNVLESIECRIMADHKTEAAPGVTGELVIRAENVMKGYFKNKEASNEVLRDGWLWTGDLGYFDEDNFLVITGRAKALLISADGEKYSPEAIEEGIINNCPYVNQIMVYNEQRRYTTMLLTLNIPSVQELIKERGITSSKELIPLLEQSIYSFRKDTKIPSQWIPSNFRIIEKEFSEEDHLINSTMKLVRHKVRDFYIDQIESLYSTEGSKIDCQENLAILKTLFKLQ